MTLQRDVRLKASIRPKVIANQDNPTVAAQSDEDIVRLLQQRMDTKLFGVLYDRYVQKVYHKCLGMTRDKELAKDLAHDIFLKAFVNMSKFGFRSSFSTWLYSITYNYCLDHLRKGRKIHKQSVDDRIDLVDSNEDLYEKEMFQLKSERLDVVLGEIDPEDRGLLLMKYQEELSVKDIAQVMSLSESAVKMRMLRARARTLEKYKQLFPDSNE